MDEVHWWEDPIFDAEGDAWRRIQHRKVRVARFLAAVRCTLGGARRSDVLCAWRTRGAAPRSPVG